MSKLPAHVKEQADKAMAEGNRGNFKVPAVNESEAKRFDKSLHADNIEKVHNMGVDKDSSNTDANRSGPDKG